MKQRVRYRVSGIVQSVGFRPFIVRMARSEHLTGFVFNDAKGVEIEVEGARECIENFERKLYDELPPLARIDELTSTSIPLAGDTSFEVHESPYSEKRDTLIMADMALCDDCLRELYTPSDKRYLYPFITCTNCGPRYSIIRTVPYDRPMTTMAEFPMCSYCQEQYEDIMNRRFKAEPVACDDCGPIYSWYCVGDRNKLYAHDALEMARKDILAGKIVAIKGIGGYHLACDATNDETVRRLRQLKQRPVKPFALMAGSLETIKKYSYISKEEESLLRSQARPIVLLKKKEMDDSLLSTKIAEGTNYLGWMLPYAGVQHLLLKPNDIWVMTSGNPKGYAIQYNDEGLSLLEPLCDSILTHNRDIIAAVDDSVRYVSETGEHFIRRSRGYVPLPLSPTLSQEYPPILAMGGDLKNTFTLTRKSSYFIGPHLGDMAILSAREAAEEAVLHYEDIFATQPAYLAIDAHPNYISSVLGKELAKKLSIPYMEINHHQAHIGAIMAEHEKEWKSYCKENYLDPVETISCIGLAFDGTGYGTDGHIWGSELLYLTEGTFKRLAHLSYMPLYQGDLGVKEPWRQAVVLLRKKYGSPHSWPRYWKEWQKGLPLHWEVFLKASHALPQAKQSSMGRLFDLVGTLLGSWYEASFDGEIPMRLEALAHNQEGSIGRYAIYQEDEMYHIDMLPFITDILDMMAESKAEPAYLAASFHKTIIAAYMEVLSRLEKEHPELRNLPVALGGGSWMNRLLEQELLQYISKERVWTAHEVPMNDGGLSLGQAYIAYKQLTDHKGENHLCV